MTSRTEHMLLHAGRNPVVDCLMAVGLALVAIPAALWVIWKTWGDGVELPRITSDGHAKFE